MQPQCIPLFKKKLDHDNEKDHIHLPTGLLIELEEDFSEEEGTNAVGENGEGDFAGGG